MCVREYGLIVRFYLSTAVQGVLHDQPGPAAVVLEHHGGRQQPADHNQRTDAAIYLHYTRTSVHERRSWALVYAHTGQDAARR